MNVKNLLSLIDQTTYIMRPYSLLCALLSLPLFAQAQTSLFLQSLPARLAAPMTDSLVWRAHVELPAPRRVMQSFDITTDSTLYLSQLGAFENHIPGRTHSHEIYILELPLQATSPTACMTLRYFGHAANIAVEERPAARYVWCDSNATCLDGEYWESCTVSRFAFEAGAVLDFCGGDTFYLDDSAFNLLPAVNVEADLLSLSYRKRDGTHGFCHFRLSEALALPDTTILRERCWGGEAVGESRQCRERAIRCKDLRRLQPVAAFTLAHGTDPLTDFCSYPFQGFDIDGHYCYLFEGAGNGNKPTNGPSHARLTVTTLRGEVLYWRLPLEAYSDRAGLAACNITDSGYVEAEGVKRKGDRLWVGAASRCLTDAIRRANVLCY
jgi:hypothetical protein